MRGQWNDGYVGRQRRRVRHVHPAHGSRRGAPGDNVNIRYIHPDVRVRKERVGRRGGVQHPENRVLSDPDLPLRRLGVNVIEAVDAGRPQDQIGSCILVCGELAPRKDDLLRARPPQPSGSAPRKARIPTTRRSISGGRRSLWWSRGGDLIQRRTVRQEIILEVVERGSIRNSPPFTETRGDVVESNAVFQTSQLETEADAAFPDTMTGEVA